MGNNFTVNKVKCQQCNRTFKSKKHDIPTIADNCPNEHCALRTSKYTKIMDILRNQNAKPQLEIVEVDDPILIKVDEDGNIKTLQP